MKYIHSLFIRSDQNPFECNFGWISPYYHLMSWALSCLTIKKQLGKISLYCNKRAKELLVDILDLPYDEVHETMNNWDTPHPKLWALSKIHTYAQQKEPFLHIDGDVFLFGKLPNRIFTSSICAQNIEEFTDYYYSFMKPINRKFTYQPECLKEDFAKMENLHALNAGILGGCDVDFFKRYTSEAFKYVEANLANLSELDANRFNVFFEQHLCYKMAEENHIKVEYLLPQTYHDNSYLGLDKFHEILSGKTTYLHLLGNYKADEFTCQQMAKTLHAIYPQYYYKIINLFPNIAKEYNNIEDDNNCINCFWDNNYQSGLAQRTLKKFSWVPQNLSIGSQEDYNSFSKNIDVFLKDSTKFNKSYLNGRDCLSFYWYNAIINNGCLMQTSPVIKIIQSSYDWAKLYRASRTSGIEYYNSNNGNLNQGLYYSLVISELNEEGFSLFDIDEFEVAILNLCKDSITIDRLTSELLSIIEPPIRNDQILMFKDLVAECLKRLILMKALQPSTDIY